MTRQEFISWMMESRNVKPEFRLSNGWREPPYERRIVLRCQCDYGNCLGWRAIGLTPGDEGCDVRMSWASRQPGGDA